MKREPNCNIGFPLLSRERSRTDRINHAVASQGTDSVILAANLSIRPVRTKAKMLNSTLVELQHIQTAMLGILANEVLTSSQRKVSKNIHSHNQSPLVRHSSSFQLEQRSTQPSRHYQQSPHRHA